MRNKTKHIVLITIASLLSLGSLFSQVTDSLAGEQLDSMINSGQICFDPVSEDDSIYVFVEQMPEFPGGKNGLMIYIAENLEYPKEFREGGPVGTILLRFEVKNSGETGRIEIIRSPDPLWDKEVIRIIKTLPDFTPGMQNGTPVNVWYTLPIHIDIN